MGGDHAPAIVIKGANLARERFPEVQFVFFGKQTEIEAELKAFPKLKEVSTIKHTDEFIPNDMRPSLALRTAKQSS
jgi:glycerol-3-phosphate acyltransferase PlsX